MVSDYLIVKGLEAAFEPLVKDKITNLIKDVLKAWKNKDNPPLGACYFNPRPGADFWRLMDAGFRNSTTVKILCTTGYTTYGPGGATKLGPALQQKDKGEARFLLLSPRLKNIIERRVKEIPPKYGYTSEMYKREILNTRHILKKLREADSYLPDIELRYFKNYPSCRIFIYDDSITFVQPYLAGKLGDVTPVIGFKKASKKDGFSLFTFFQEHFDKSFELGQEAFPSSFR